jgi:protein-tyrosine-phosphatase
MTAQPKSATVYFVCLHGSAKSLIAAQHFNRLAGARGLPHRAESMGVEPDAEVPPPVIAGLARDGFEMRGYTPQALDSARLAGAGCVVSIGCELPPIDSADRVERWNDLPLVSDGFDRARDAIIERVEQLVDALARDASRMES